MFLGFEIPYTILHKYYGIQISPNSKNWYGQKLMA